MIRFLAHFKKSNLEIKAKKQQSKSVGPSSVGSTQPFLNV